CRSPGMNCCRCNRAPVTCLVTPQLANAVVAGNLLAAKVTVLVGVSPRQINDLVEERIQRRLRRKETEAPDFVCSLLTNLDGFTAPPETVQFCQSQVIGWQGHYEISQLLDRFGRLQVPAIAQVVLESCPAPIRQARKIVGDK